MPTAQGERLVILQAARLKGRLTPELATVFAGERASSLVELLAGDGLLKAGASGARLTREGKERLTCLLAEERAGVDLALLTQLYAEFDQPNDALKAVVTGWQLCSDGQPNDHADSAYDEGVIRRLSEAHAQAQPLVQRLSSAVERFAPYPQRLANALSRALAGDHRFVAHPMVDSYHQVWFELHEDLIGLLGLSREAEALAGRAE